MIASPASVLTPYRLMTISDSAATTSAVPMMPYM